MNKWFELPYSPKELGHGTFHKSGFRVQSSLRKIFLGPDTMSQGEHSAKTPTYHPRFREGKKNSHTILKKASAFVGESLVPPMSLVIGHPVEGPL